MPVRAIPWKVQKVIEMKLGVYIDGSERKGSAQEPSSNPIHLQSYLFLILFIKGGFLCHVLVYK